MALAMPVEGGCYLASVLPSDLYDKDDKQLLAFANRTVEINPVGDYIFCARAQIKIFRMGDFEGALADAGAGPNLSPSYPFAYELKGLALLCLEQVADAVDMLNRAVELSKKDSYLPCQIRFLTLARFLNGDSQGALDDINIALQLRRDVCAFHQLKGIILTKLGDDSAAQ
jgi:Flp pilus assembly protein TadD